MLGTNDIMHDKQAAERGDLIKQGYDKVINTLKNLKHKPELYIMIPTPMIWHYMQKKDYNAHLSTVWIADLVKDISKVH